MGALIFNLVIVVITVGLAYARPGAGIALALALGRHTFPDRSSPIVPAAPLLLGAAVLGLYMNRRPVRLEPITAMGAALVAVITFVGGMRPGIGIDPLVDELANDRSFHLLAVTVPLIVLMPSLRVASVRRDFLLTLVAVPTALVTLSLVTGSSDPDGSGRSTALGGGPITLATAAGFAILILVFAEDDLLPSILAEFRKPFRVVAPLYLGAGMFLTGSRQPVLSLVLVMGFAVLVGTPRSLLADMEAGARRRARLVRAAAMVSIVGSVAGMGAFIAANPNGRFALLLDPTAELRRSRIDVWSAGFDQAITSPLFGHGFGSFIRIDIVGGHLPYPHNVFLELMSETGPLVGAMGCAAIVFGLIAGRRCRHRVIWLLALYALFGVQFSGDLYNSRYLMAFIVASLTTGTIGRQASGQHRENRLLSAEPAERARVLATAEGKSEQFDE